MAPLGLDALDEVLDHPLTHFVTQDLIVFEDGTDGFRFQQLRTINY